MLSAVLSTNRKLLLSPTTTSSVHVLHCQSRMSSAQREKVALADARPPVGLAHLKVYKVETQLADVLIHGPYLQLAVLHVTGHDRRKVGRHNVRDVVDDFLVAGCNDCTQKGQRWRKGETKVV